MKDIFWLFDLNPNKIYEEMVECSHRRCKGNTDITLFKQEVLETILNRLLGQNWTHEIPCHKENNLNIDRRMTHPETGTSKHESKPDLEAKSKLQISVIKENSSEETLNLSDTIKTNKIKLNLSEGTFKQSKTIGLSEVPEAFLERTPLNVNSYELTFHNKAPLI